MLKKGTLLETAFEEYQILNQIGQGGNGTVFLAQASSDSNKVAVKIIDKNISTKDKIKRFKNEINFCQKNSSENIISVLDYGVYNDGGKNCLFYVMPYYESTLKHEIQKGIEPLKIIEIFIQILNGIEFAHTKNVWHRDLKPENILYNPKENKAVIADFGIAHFCEEEIITAVETKAGERLANYLYSAPEQKIKGSIINGRADIFALGLILNEMFTKNIISGTKYKLIKESCEEYAYLDEVVSELIAQNQNERLYPAKKILIELTTRSKMEVNKKEIEKLASKKLEVDDNYNLILSAPNVSSLEYKNNVLFIHLDRVTDETWNKILKQGEFSHSSLMSYNTYSFSSSISSDKMHTIFNVTVRNENESTIKDIVKYFKEWIPTVNSIYIHQQKQSKDELRRQEIARREFEIKGAEKNISINDQLKSLI